MKPTKHIDNFVNVFFIYRPYNTSRRIFTASNVRRVQRKSSYNKDKSSIAKNINQLTYKMAIIIALFTTKNDILTMNTNC